MDLLKLFLHLKINSEWTFCFWMYWNVLQMIVSNKPHIERDTCIISTLYGGEFSHFQIEMHLFSQKWSIWCHWCRLSIRIERKLSQSLNLIFMATMYFNLYGYNQLHRWSHTNGEVGGGKNSNYIPIWQ